jgi:hypothetical protein
MSTPRDSTGSFLLNVVAVSLLSSAAVPPAAAQRDLYVQRITVEHRYALVIGNAKYKHAPALGNPVNDAKAVTDKLRSLGFDVHEGEDLTFPEIGEMVDRFQEKLKADPSSIGVFYYSGHGAQLENENYLIPSEFALSSADDLVRKAAGSAQSGPRRKASGRTFARTHSGLG